MALSKVPAYKGPYVPGGFNAAQIASLTKKKVPTAASPPLAPNAGYNLLNPFVPPAASPASSSGTDTGGGGTKTTLAKVPTGSYKFELQSDPLYAGTEEAYQSSLTSGRQSLINQIQNAILQSGYDIRGKTPSDLASYINEIDPATFSAALANPLTARAQLQQALDRGRNDLGYQLAGRGTLRSGALTVGNSNLQEGYDTQSNSQLNDLLNALRGGVGDYTNLLGNADAAHRANLQAIADRLAQMQGSTYDDPNAPDPGPGPGAGGPPAPNPVANLPGNVYNAPADPGAGNQFGTLDPGLAAALSPGWGGFTGGAAPSTPAPPPSGVNWGGQTFTTKASLSRYLQARNENPNVWAIQHPSAWNKLS